MIVSSMRKLHKVIAIYFFFYIATLSYLKIPTQSPVTAEINTKSQIPNTKYQISNTSEAFNVTTSLSKSNESGKQTFDITVTSQTDFDGFISQEIPLYLIPENPNQNVTQQFVLRNHVRLRYPFDKPYPITLQFGDKPDDEHLNEGYRKFGVIAHDGVDFVMPEKTLILAVDDGIVIPIPEDGKYGNTVVIQHLWGRSLYGHLNTLAVTLGQRITKGDVVAISGNTGLSTGPHLHLGILPNENDKLNGYYGKVNPLKLINEVNKYTSSSQQLIWRLQIKKGDIKQYTYSFMVREGYEDNPLDFGPINVVTEDNLIIHSVN